MGAITFEVNRQRQVLCLLAHALSRPRKRAHLRKLLWDRHGPECLLGAVVVRIEHGAIDRDWPAFEEHLRWYSQLDVGIYKRPSTHPRGGNDREISHQVQIEQPMRIQRRM